MDLESVAIWFLNQYPRSNLTRLYTNMPMLLVGRQNNGASLLQMSANTSTMDTSCIASRSNTCEHNHEAITP